MNEYLALLLGVVCAGVGGELFVRGAVGLGHWARISPGIIGATVWTTGQMKTRLRGGASVFVIGCVSQIGGNVGHWSPSTAWARGG